MGHLPPKRIGLPPSPLQAGLITSPAMTMGVVGALVGGVVGYGLGGTAGWLLGRSLALKGAAIGATLAGVKGVQEGKELGRWIRSI